MVLRRRTEFPGLPRTAVTELLRLQDDLRKELDDLANKAEGLTSDTYETGTHTVRYFERARCQPRAAGVDLIFPESSPVASNRWLVVLHLGGAGDVRCTSPRGTVQGVSLLTLTAPGAYQFEPDATGGWWTHPIP